MNPWICVFFASLIAVCLLGFFSRHLILLLLNCAVKAVCPYFSLVLFKNFCRSPSNPLCNVFYFSSLCSSYIFFFSVWFSHSNAYHMYVYICVCVCTFISFCAWCNRDLSVEKVIWTRVQHPIKKTGILKGYSY